MFQQQKKRAGRRGQRRMPADLETPSAFAARKCTNAAPPPPFVRTLHARSRRAGRAIADAALRAVCGSLSRAKRRTERTTRCREREARNHPPPRRGFAARPFRSPHSSLHSTARNLQLGARIATRNPQLASKRGRPMHPRAPKMRLISVQMFHVKHSTLNLRFSHARRPPPRRRPSVARHAARTLAPPAAVHRAPSATHVEPRPTAAAAAAQTPPAPRRRTPATRRRLRLRAPSRLSAIHAERPRHRTCPPPPRTARGIDGGSSPTPRLSRSPQATCQAPSRGRCRNPYGGATARPCSA